MHHVKPKIVKPDGKQRLGKGFSRDEIAKVGLTTVEALKLEVPVDFKRKTAHDKNVEAVKAYVEKQKASAKPKAERKKKSKSEKSP